MKKAGITAIPSTGFGSVSYPPEGLIHDFSDPGAGRCGNKRRMCVGAK